MNGEKYISICVIMFFLFIIIGNATAGVDESLTNAKILIQNTSTSSFKAEDLKESYLFDLDGISSTILIAMEETETSVKTQIYQDALNTVNKLISKSDGCVDNLPDAENWLINCADASLVKEGLNQVAADITLLIQ